MKSKLKLLGFIVSAALIAFSFAACGDGDGSTDSSGINTSTQTFTGNKDGAVYVLTISSGRAAMGDSYTLTYTFQNEVKTSSGTIVSISGVYNYTLQPSIPSGSVSFIITVNNNGHITQIQDTITWNNGTTSPGPGAVNPGTGSGNNPVGPPSPGQTFTVYFSPPSVFFTVDGTLPPPQTVNAGSSITLPSGDGFSKPGYTFTGWTTAGNWAGLGGTNYNAGSSFTPTADTFLYTRWKNNAGGIPENHPLAGRWGHYGQSGGREFWAWRYEFWTDGVFRPAIGNYFYTYFVSGDTISTFDTLSDGSIEITGISVFSITDSDRGPVLTLSRAGPELPGIFIGGTYYREPNE